MGGRRGLAANGELPAHPVRLEPFSIGKYEITFAQYDRFARSTRRPMPDDEGWGRGDRPVINVSWGDARAYTDWLSKQTGKRYRLPTEAEWEYCCRAGTTSNYCFANSERQLKEYAVYNDTPTYGGNSTAPVGSLKPNAWELYDMHGNVWEWCLDAYAGDYYSKSPGTDPVNLQACSSRISRGGSWCDDAFCCRSSDRNYWCPLHTLYSLGFRVVLAPAVAF